MGVAVAVVDIRAGVKQGRPLSATIFIIAADPLLRALLANATLVSAPLSAFAVKILLTLASTTCNRF